MLIITILPTTDNSNDNNPNIDNDNNDIATSSGNKPSEEMGASSPVRRTAPSLPVLYYIIVYHGMYDINLYYNILSATGFEQTGVLLLWFSKGNKGVDKWGNLKRMNWVTWLNRDAFLPRSTRSLRKHRESTHPKRVQRAVLLFHPPFALAY